MEVPRRWQVRNRERGANVEARVLLQFVLLPNLSSRSRIAAEVRMPPQPVSTNPKTIAAREWYAKHKSDPVFMEKQRQRIRESRERRKGTPEFKAQKAKHDLKYRLSIRDTEEFRKKRNVFNTKYQSDPVLCETFRRSSASWRKRHPDKVRAHNVVKYAIRDGELTIPERCSRCNALDVPQRDGRRSLHAHHKDYAKPLDVEWLCSFCHGNERRKH